MKKLLIFCIIWMISAGVTGFSVHAHYYEPVTAEIETEIILGGSAMIISNIDSPVPEQTEIRLKDGETGKFDIHFTKVGVYDYIVKTIPDERKINFDKTVYHVQVYVTDENDELAVNFVISKGNDKYGNNHLIFVNTLPDTEKDVSSPKSGDTPATEIYVYIMLVSTIVTAFSVMDTRKISA